MESRRKVYFTLLPMNEKGSVLLPVLLFFVLLLSASTVIAAISVDRIRHAEMMSVYYQESAGELWNQE